VPAAIWPRDPPRALITVSSAERRSATIRAASSSTTKPATVRLTKSSQSSASTDCAVTMNWLSEYHMPE
jgi:hypothetical protein